MLRSSKERLEEAMILFRSRRIGLKDVDVEIKGKFAKAIHLGRGGRETDSSGFLASVSDRRLFGNWSGSINLVGGKFGNRKLG